MPKLAQALERADANEVEKEVQAMIEDKLNLVNATIMEMQSNGIDVRNDIDVMKARGQALLTKEETEYYAAVIEKNTFDDIDKTFPTTIFDRVFKDLRANHPLLSRIKMQNVSGMTEWLVRTKEVETAWWGPLCGPIKKQIEQGFKKIQLGQKKLSAFIPVCKSMLVLSPSWLDVLVTEMLYESIAIGLEKSIILGSGVNQPIGLLKDLTSPLVTEPTGDGDSEPAGHKEKTPEVISDFSAKSIGGVLKKFVKGRVINAPELTIIVNPSDYYGIVYPATTYQTSDGKFIYENIPGGIEFIQSAYMPEGKASIGILNNYFMGIAAPTKVEYSDHYRFLEDDRVYIAKLIGDGRPESNDDFMVLDISGIGA